MIYLDTSFVIALLTPEAHSERAARWVAEVGTKTLYISPWVATEVSSALSIKVRTGAIDVPQRAQISAGWQRLKSENLVSLSMADVQFESAARFVDHYESGLRAGDALHLAIAREAGCSLATFDRTMAAAAPALGVPVTPIP